MRLFRVLLSIVASSLAISAQRTPEQPSRRPEVLREAALQQIVPLTSGLREDDHPAIASRDGIVWLAWVSYSEIEGTTHVYARSLRDGRWSQVEQVSDKAGDYSKPAVAVDADGAIWVAWPAQVDGNWDLYGRGRKPLGGWGGVERWSEHAGPDLAPQLAAGDDGMMLVWQGLHGDNFDIFFRLRQGGKWGPETAVTESPASDWAPAVAATKTAFHVVWDSYRGDYDVLLRSFEGGQWSREKALAGSPRLENNAALSVDSLDRVWVAFEVGPEEWASDSANGGLRARRELGLACLDSGQLYRADQAELSANALFKESGLQAPLATVGKDGKLRLFYRRPMNKNWLEVGMLRWDGAGWEAPETLLYSEGRIDQRVVAADIGDALLVAYPAGSSHNVLYAKSYSVGNAGATDGTPPLAAIPDTEPKPAPPPPARHEFNGYRVAWGDLHRHTDISEDGGLVDGSLVDGMRYAIDAAEMDFLGVTDHTRYLTRRYNVWRIQQISDLFNKPGAFIGMHAYERSQFSPWGHRNVVHLDRDYVPVPASYDIGDFGVSPWGLFDALRGKKAISIPHTSAWVNKQVSWDYNDEEVERLVEIYQGLRSTYEYKGAPDPADRVVYEPDSRNFVWNALERKLKLGFIASSDHRSTHMSFAAVYTKELDRGSIFEGLYARRTYAATDKIFVDFAIAGTMMGGEATIEGVPELEVAVEGTTDLDQIDVIKNNTFAYQVRPQGRKARFTFRDHEYTGEEAYYYVRVIQKDKNMAWASPIWVRPKR